MMASIFRVLPDAKTQWRDLWPGAALSALLFNCGKYFIGLYLGRTTVTSGYGAARSFIVVLLWIYYSSQIFLLNAEFTHVLTVEQDKNVHPNTNTVHIS